MHARQHSVGGEVGMEQKKKKKEQVTGADTVVDGVGRGGSAKIDQK